MTRKFRVFATCDIGEALNVLRQRGYEVEVYREPSPDGYRVARRLARGADVAPAAFPDIVLSVNEILG